VFYASREVSEFYWVSALDATYSRNLASRPRLSIVIFDSRLYRATVSQHWILCTRRELGSPCPLHGRAFDHRIPVAL
jgi:hypothetical protein